MNPRLFVFLLLCAMSVALWRPVASQPVNQAAPAPLVAKVGAVRVDHVEAELVASTTEWDPAVPLQLALRLKHDPHWHTYWRNAGDSGLPTQLTWTLPTGASAGPIEWPLPTRIGIANLANYGYEGDLLLPVTITALPAASANRVTPVRFQVQAQWLVCREVCIPGEALLALDLPTVVTGSSKNKALTPSAFAAAFTQAQARAPSSSLNGVTVLVESANKTAALILPRTAGDQLKPGITAADIEFFPYVEAWIQPSAPQKVLRTESALVLGLTLADSAPQLAAGPIGVLRINDQIREVIARPAIGALPQGELLGLVEVTQSRDLNIKGSAAQVSAVVVPKSTTAAPSPDQTPAPRLNAAPSLSLWLALSAAFIGGLLLNLMPCVLPVLSIKLLSVMQNKQHQKRDASWFAIGVVSSFLILAVALFALRGAGQAIGWGFQLQSPLFVMSLTVLFTVLALNMAGLFELGTGVVRLTNLAEQPGRTSASGPSSAFWAGVLAVVAASPCSAPFMGSALGYALAAPLHELLLVFFALGLGMALPFWVLAFIPALSRFVPKPGAWMLLFKQALAFPLLATVAWLLWVFGLQTDMNQLFVLMLALILVAALCWLWGRRQLRSRSSASSWMALGLVALGAATLLIKIGNETLAETRVTTPAINQAQPAGEWQPFSPELLAQSLASGKPVFIDFTAAWCVSCQVNKQAVLNAKSMREFFAAKQVVLLRADWTKKDAVITRALNGYGRHAVPVYVVYKAGQSQPVLLPELLTESLVTASF
jgi:thiol:disulfide interchange protein/DsbC/DsbD-like thiol-disulfide interchange protein